MTGTNPLGPWADYANVSKPDGISLFRDSALEDVMSAHQRLHPGCTSLQTQLSYAQNNTVFVSGVPQQVDHLQYINAPDIEKLNRFDAHGPSYNPAQKTLLLDKRLAEVVSEAAHDIGTKGYYLRVYDGLRTMEAGYLLAAANLKSLEIGLLAKPGNSAHNKGLALDCMAYSKSTGKELDMGAHFDHFGMKLNHRNTQAGSGTEADGSAFTLTAQQYENRLIMERAFQKAALKKGMLIAPLREEFWDFRVPETRLDLWRVMESVARCIDDSPGKALLNRIAGTVNDINMKLREANKAAREGRADDAQKLRMQVNATYNFASYDDFKAKWAEIFKDQEAKLQEVLGVSAPPETEANVVYHGVYHPIYDRDLPEAQRLANPALASLMQGTAKTATR